MVTQRFTITEEHLKLLQRMYVSWEDCEFGAPSIDCKRPYGNSDVYGDIAEILGIKSSDDEDEPFTEAQHKAMNKIHKEMKTVLQIGVRLLKFEVGSYECESYLSNWRKI